MDLTETTLFLADADFFGSVFTTFFNDAADGDFLVDDFAALALRLAATYFLIAAAAEDLLDLTELFESADLADLAVFVVAFLPDALLFLLGEPPLFTAFIVISDSVLLSFSVF